jgi:glucose-6-phosphate-specific signal transduction histidine kinase
MPKYENSITSGNLIALGTFLVMSIGMILSGIQVASAYSERMAKLETAQTAAAAIDSVAVERDKDLVVLVKELRTEFLTELASMRAELKSDLKDIKRQTK